MPACPGPEVVASPGGERAYVERVTRRWIRNVVVGLNLCPFASRELTDDRLQILVTPARTEGELLQALDDALERLVQRSDAETAVVVHPQVLQAFEAYLDFLPLAEQLLIARGEEGVFQIASFHPDYCFAGVPADDAANYSNRSPYPMLHLLREASVTRAVERHPDAAGIPSRNERVLREQGEAALDRAWHECFDD